MVQSRNEAEHNIRVGTWKSQPKNTESKVQSPRTPPGAEVPKGTEKEARVTWPDSSGDCP